MKTLKLLAITLLACFSFSLAGARPAQNHKKHAHAQAHHKANKRHHRKARHHSRKTKHHHKVNHKPGPRPKK
jgi:hypothetical protein